MISKDIGTITMPVVERTNNPIETIHPSRPTGIVAKCAVSTYLIQHMEFKCQIRGIELQTISTDRILVTRQWWLGFGLHVRDCNLPILSLWVWEISPVHVTIKLKAISSVYRRNPTNCL